MVREVGRPVVARCPRGFGFGGCFPAGLSLVPHSVLVLLPAAVVVRHDTCTFTCPTVNDCNGIQKRKKMEVEICDYE